jgi:hypothetical protein
MTPMRFRRRSSTNKGESEESGSAATFLAVGLRTQATRQTSEELGLAETKPCQQRPYLVPTP